MRYFVEKGIADAKGELTQLHVMDTWVPEDPTMISRADKVKAISSLVFLKEKSSRKLKGRVCVNGEPQRSYIRKEDAYSPTVANESVFITSVISAHKKRFVRCYNVSGEFLHTESDENGLIVLRGELAEMMVHIAPQIYRPYVKMDKKVTPILYVRLKKAIYVLLRSSLLLYRKLCGELEAYGFKINPYDPCVGNKMVTTVTVVQVINKKGRIIQNKNGSKKMCKVKKEKQITVIWHVDDLMMSCEDDFELTKLSCYLANIYGPKPT